eukprot:1196208-Prorocentrum_minimum.AAC.2
MAAATGPPCATIPGLLLGKLGGEQASRGPTRQPGKACMHCLTVRTSGGRIGVVCGDGRTPGHTRRPREASPPSCPARGPVPCRPPLPGPPPFTPSIDRARPMCICATSNIMRRREGGPGRGGLQGTRPRAGQLGRPAPRGLLISAFPGWRVGPLLLACSPPSFLATWG